MSTVSTYTGRWLNTFGTQATLGSACPIELIFKNSVLPDCNQKSFFQNFPKPSGDSFQSSMAGTLTVARALGLFPVRGVGNGRSELSHRPREALSIISAISTIPVLWIFITAVAYVVKYIVSTKSGDSGKYSDF